MKVERSASLLSQSMRQRRAKEIQTSQRSQRQKSTVGAKKHKDRKGQVTSGQAVGISFIKSSIDQGKGKGDGTGKPGVCQVH